MWRLGHQEHRVAKEQRRILGSGRRRVSMMILLRFHPAILTAVAVFLINMLILHEHTIKLWTSHSIHEYFPETTWWNGLDVVQGVSSLQARVIWNTFDQGSIEARRVVSSLVKSYVFPASILLVEDIDFHCLFCNCNLIKRLFHLSFQEDFAVMILWLFWFYDDYSNIEINKKYEIYFIFYNKIFYFIYF